MLLDKDMNQALQNLEPPKAARQRYATIENNLDNSEMVNRGVDQGYCENPENNNHASLVVQGSPSLDSDQNQNQILHPDTFFNNNSSQISLNQNLDLPLQYQSQRPGEHFSQLGVNESMTFTDQPPQPQFDQSTQSKVLFMNPPD